MTKLNALFLRGKPSRPGERFLPGSKRDNEDENMRRQLTVFVPVELKAGRKCNEL